MKRSHPGSAANVMSIRPRLSQQRSPPWDGGGGGGGGGGCPV